MSNRMYNLNKNENEAAHKLRDIQSNKLLLMLSIAFVSAMGLMVLYRGFNTPGKVNFTYHIALGLTIISAVIFAGCLIWMFRNKQNGVDERLKTITSVNTAMTSFVFLICTACIYFYAVIAIRALYVVIPIYVGLYFISKIYSGGLFTIAVFSTINGIGFYILYHLQDNVKFTSYYTFLVSALGIICMIELFVVAAAAKNGGELKGIGLIARGKPIYWLYLAPAVGLGDVILWFAIRGEMLRYGLLATIICILACIAVYTVDLMKNE